LIVSAHKDFAPILLSSNGLPTYYTWRTSAEEKAKEVLNTSSLQLTRFFFGPPANQMFEFEGNGKKIWVKLFPLKVYLPGEIKKIQKAEISKNEKVLKALDQEKQWVNEKWNEILKEVQNEK